MPTINPIFLSLFLTSSLLLLGCQSTVQQTDKPIATWQGGRIQLSEIQALQQKLSADLTQEPFESLRVKSPPLAKLITDEAMHQLLAEKFLKNECTTEDTSPCTFESYFEQDFKISTAELQKHFQLYQRQYQPSNQVVLQQIVLAAKTPEQLKSVQQKAKTILGKIKADPKQFETLVKQYSQDSQTISTQGITEPLPVNGLHSQFQKALANNTLETPKIITANNLVYIVKRVKTIPAKQTTFEDVRPIIEKKLLAQKKQTVINQWVFDKLQKQAITFDPDYNYLKEIDTLKRRYNQAFENEKLKLQKEIQNQIRKENSKNEYSTQN